MRYPDIKVRLTGEDGNAFMIVGRVAGALRKGGVPRDEVEEFKTEALSGDYNHVIQTATDWVEVS
jgi:hypothetical protein